MVLTTAQTNQLNTILEDLKPHLDDMTGASPGFVRDQIERFGKYKADTFMSPKQWDWLNSLHEKFCGTIDSKADTGGQEELHPNHPDADRAPRKAAAPKKATRRNSDMDDDIPF